MSRYPEYKVSGVEWLGELPAHWGVKRLRYLSAIRKGRLPVETYPLPTADSDLPYLSMEFLRGDTDNPNYVPASPNLLRAEAGDILLLWDGSNAGEFLRAKPGVVSSTVALIESIQIERDFLFFACKALETRIKDQTVGMGIPHVSGDDLRSCSIPCPNQFEQRQIAAFLDRETAKIDALVAEQEKLIALLKEKRQAVISHAVTKGLDPNVPMKDSGIEWLGDVPVHWDVTRLGWICSEINDINHVMPVAVERGVPFLSAKDLLDDGTLNFTNDIKLISEEDFASLSKKICPRRGDIIYSRIGACLGKARLVETDERFLVSYSCCVIRVIETIGSRRFIQHLLDGEMILTEARMRTQGIGVPDLGLGEIGRFPVPLPPIREQEQIADFLDERAGRFDELTAEAQRAIDLLQERRAALISAAVTGKIDVRGAATLEAAA